MSEKQAEYDAGNRQPGCMPPNWEPVKVRLGDLDHWQQNPKLISKADARRLLHSSDKLGKLQTISIGPRQADGTCPLYDGHQRVNVWGAAYGMDLQVWALQADRPLTEDERKDVAVLTMTARGQFDWDVLAAWEAQPEWGFNSEMLREWNSDAAALSLLLSSEVDYDELWQGMPEFQQDDLSPMKSVVVHFISQDAVDVFSQLMEQKITDKTRFIWYPKMDRENLKALVAHEQP